MTSPPFLGRSQLWLAVACVLVLQVLLIFWLGTRQPVRPRATEPAPRLRLVGRGCAELMEVLDPTLFALPHEKGFSGPGWLIPPAQEIQPFAWSEPPRWLELPLGRLGALPDELAAASHLDPLPPLVRPEPELLLPRISDSRTFSDRSAFELEGDLASRRLLTVLELPSWPHNDLVRNSVVQLVVDAEGLPFSVTLIERSGCEPADRFALKEARRVRFESLGPVDHARARDLVWGTIVFRWHTIPATGAAAGGEAGPP